MASHKIINNKNKKKGREDAVPHREYGVRSANEAEWSESVNFSRFHIGGTSKNVTSATCLKPFVQPTQPKPFDFIVFNGNMWKLEVWKVFV